jgi:hypothetical protein
MSGYDFSAVALDRINSAEALHPVPAKTTFSVKRRQVIGVLDVGVSGIR